MMIPKAERAFGISLSIALVVMTSGCLFRREAPSFEPPSLTSGFTHFAGSPLSGPVDPAAIKIPEKLRHVRVAAAFVERLPETLLSPVSPQSHLISTRGRDDFLLPTLDLGRGTMVGLGVEEGRRFDDAITRGDLGQSVPVARGQGVLGPDISVEFTLTSGRERRRPEIPVAFHPILSLVIGDPSPGIDTMAPLLLALSFDGLAARPQEVAAPPVDASTERPKVLHGETIMVEFPPEGERYVAVVAVPSPFEGHETAGVVIRVEVAPPPGGSAGAEGHAVLVARCREDLERSARTYGPADASAAPAPVWTEQAAGTDDPRPPSRRSLAYFARASGARLAEDAALSAPLPIIARIRDTALIGLSKLDDAWPERALLAWFLEQAAYLVLSEAVDAEDANRALEALLIRHAGEVGRHPDLVKEIVKGASSLEGFSLRLVEENTIFLEDTNPAARVRAIDWLRARGIAVEGYSALAPREKRRTALRRSLEKSTKGDAK